MLFLLLFLSVLLPSWAAAVKPADPLVLPETPRIMALSGAFIALAEDPQAGIYNPAALRRLPRVGMDLSFSTATSGAPDHAGIALANPGTDRGAAFASGIWEQGLLEKRGLVYAVPYTGTGMDITGTTHLGLVLRFPYRASYISGIDSRWATIADVTLLQTVRGFRFGAGVERAVGGGKEFVPRRLRWGLAYQSESGFTLAWQWQGLETDDRYDFHRAASQLGLEIPVVRYALLRGGYSWSATDRFSVGAAIGNIQEGFRIEAAWALPSSGTGATRWSIGAGYRI